MSNKPVDVSQSGAQIYEVTYCRLSKAVSSGFAIRALKTPLRSTLLMQPVIQQLLRELYSFCTERATTNNSLPTKQMKKEQKKGWEKSAIKIDKLVRKAEYQRPQVMAMVMRHHFHGGAQ